MNRSACRWVLWGFLWVPLQSAQTRPAAATAEAAPSAVAASPQDFEAQLLHRELSLRDLQSFSVRRGTWQALPASRARVRVVSLWSLRCQPCLDELPKLTELAAEYRKQGQDVEFLFVADPPEESSRQEVEAFWRDPLVDRLLDSCEAKPLGEVRQRDGRKSCRLDLHGIDAVRSRTEAGFLSLRQFHVRPLTLLLDPQGTVRQAFVGSLLRRTDLLTESIERLRLRLRQRAQATGPTQSRAL